MSNIERHPQCPMRTTLGNCNPIGGFCTSVNESICEAFHRLYKPQGEWIPCSEQQPSKDGNYLVCHTICGKTTAVDIAGYAKNLRKVDKYDLPKNKNGWYQYDSEYGYYETDGIVAWMPLPKPYEGRAE